MKKDVAGVYCIKNKKNKHLYIGSSKHVSSRLREHLTQLEAHTHSNKYLQEAFDKDGLEFFILEFLPDATKEELLACEQEWISKYNTVDRNKGYNKVNPNNTTYHTKSRRSSKSEKLRLKPLPYWAQLLEEFSVCDPRMKKLWLYIKVMFFY